MLPECTCTQAERGRRETLEEGSSCDLKAAQVTLQIESWLWLLACHSQPWTGLATSLPCCCLSSQSSCRAAPLCLCWWDGCWRKPKQRFVVLRRNVFFFATKKALSFVFEFSRLFLELSVCREINLCNIDTPVSRPSKEGARFSLPLILCKIRQVKQKVARCLNFLRKLAFYK